jgi:hypothetical protein
MKAIIKMKANALSTPPDKFDASENMIWLFINLSQQIVNESNNYYQREDHENPCHH